MKLVLGFVAMVFILLGGSYALHESTKEMVEVTVKKTDRECFGSGDSVVCKYMVYTSDEVFENTDTIFDGKFNSTNLQNILTVGKTYKFLVTGHRMPALSSFRNILSVRESE